MDITLTSNAAFDRAIAPVLNVLSRDQAARIVEFHADATLQNRIEELASKSNEGELSDSEMAEYEGYALANRFIAVLQAKAQGLVDASNGQQ